MMIALSPNVLTSRSLMISPCPVSAFSSLPLRASQIRTIPSEAVVNTIGRHGCHLSLVIPATCPATLSCLQICRQPLLLRSQIFRTPSTPPVAHQFEFKAAGANPTASTLAGTSIPSLLRLTDCSPVCCSDAITFFPPIWQTCAIPSSAPTRTNWLSFPSLVARQVSPAPWSPKRKTCLHTPVLGAQTRKVPSELQLNAHFPSDVKAPAVAPFSCPTKTCMHFDVGM
mmetsp:Transcript_17946/g.26562  ORF Transcript_17946/g.26562 Transcript_17946/m.26562 type:complete len:227 (-) Transcript_17946:669-1349(-)